MKQEILYWMRTWDLEDNLIYKKSATSQACFVRDNITDGLLKAHCFVVSTHYSKSCLLPVYYIKMRNGIKLIMRCNFYDWKLSVEIPESYDNLPVDYLPKDCMTFSMVEDPLEPIPSCYLEGFKEEWCYGAYNPQNPSKRFTIEVPNDYCLFTVIHYLKHAYPDIEFDMNQDTRTSEEITAAIEKILDENGYNDMYDRKDFGKVFKSRRMSLYEIIWRLHYKIETLYYEKKVDKNSLGEGDNLAFHVDMIMRYPEIHKEFLMEEYLYND